MHSIREEPVDLSGPAERRSEGLNKEMVHLNKTIRSEAESVEVKDPVREKSVTLDSAQPKRSWWRWWTSATNQIPTEIEKPLPERIPDSEAKSGECAKPVAGVVVPEKKSFFSFFKFRKKEQEERIQDSEFRSLPIEEAKKAEENHGGPGKSEVGDQKSEVRRQKKDGQQESVSKEGRTEEKRQERIKVSHILDSETVKGDEEPDKSQKSSGWFRWARKTKGGEAGERDQRSEIRGQEEARSIEKGSQKSEVRSQPVEDPTMVRKPWYAFWRKRDGQEEEKPEARSQPASLRSYGGPGKPAVGSQKSEVRNQSLLEDKRAEESHIGHSGQKVQKSEDRGRTSEVSLEEETNREINQRRESKKSEGWFRWGRKAKQVEGDPGIESTDAIKPEQGVDKAPYTKPVRHQESNVKPEKISSAEDARSGVIAREPMLRPGFMLRVVVLASGKKEVDESDKRVSPSGTITLPLVGTIKAEGMTIRQLAEKLKGMYSVYLLDPMVDVDFVLTDTAGSVSPWGYVTVLGRVKKPGRINFPPTRDLTLSMAIQLAEGLDSSAKLTDIKITREISGKTEQLAVDLQSVGSKGELDSDIKLRPGDVVYVPERVF